MIYTIKYQGHKMIPKSKRRTITVDGVEYEYCIQGRHSKDIYIKNLKTNEQVKWYVDDHMEYTPITPKDIRELILNRKLFGVDAR